MILMVNEDGCVEPFLKHEFKNKNMLVLYGKEDKYIKYQLREVFNNFC